MSCVAFGITYVDSYLLNALFSLFFLFFPQFSLYLIVNMFFSLFCRHLESHMLIHTDQKPFQCDACDQSFRQKQLLKRHQNLYHNPNYVPPQPKVGFAWSGIFWHFLSFWLHCGTFWLFLTKKEGLESIKRHQNLYHNPNYVPPQPKVIFGIIWYFLLFWLHSGTFWLFLTK